MIRKGRINDGTRKDAAVILLLSLAFCG